MLKLIYDVFQHNYYYGRFHIHSMGKCANLALSQHGFRNIIEMEIYLTLNSNFLVIEILVTGRCE